MAYKIVYIEDKSSDSREIDLRNLDFEVTPITPTENLKEVLSKIGSEIDALILDYRLTQGDLGDQNAFYDAPTIASTLRTESTLRSEIDRKEHPIFLMSNENNIVDFYKDFTNQNLFDYSITKKKFSTDNETFRNYLISFIEAYESIKSCNFELTKILGIKAGESELIHSQIYSKLSEKSGFIFEHSRFINDTLIHAIGPLIGLDVVCARLGVSKKSDDLSEILRSLEEFGCSYKGVFSDIHQRWWMNKVNKWWSEVINCETPLRRLDAQERVEIIKDKLGLVRLNVASKTEHSQSTNFWTICKYSQEPLDPFDGIELLKKDLLPWQEKEYFSFDSAILGEHEDDKNFVSEIDRKAIRDLVKSLNDG